MNSGWATGEHISCSLKSNRKHDPSFLSVKRTPKNQQEKHREQNPTDPEIQMCREYIQHIST